MDTTTLHNERIKFLKSVFDAFFAYSELTEDRVLEFANFLYSMGNINLILED